MEKFYIYLHIRKSDNVIFYVGKGCGDRAWDLYGRNKYWNNTINKHGYNVKIIAENLSENEAFMLEQIYIKFYGRKDKGLGFLVNLQDGGEGGDSKTTEQFINESCRLYNGKYKYHKTQYTNSSTKVIVTCSEHGDFKLTPNHHLNGRGCPECGKKTTSKKLTGLKRTNVDSYRNAAQNRVMTKEGEEQLVIARKNMISKYGIKVSVNGLTYDSIGEASRKLSIPDTTMRRRLKSKNFPEYFYN